MNPPTASFVGRKHELSVLTGALGDAIAGHGRLVMLVGEPGIGKTRTAEEFSAIAQQRGAQVLWGRCHEGEGAPPTGPGCRLLDPTLPGVRAGDFARRWGRGPRTSRRSCPSCAIS